MIVPVAGDTSKRYRWPRMGLVAPKRELSYTNAACAVPRLMSEKLGPLVRLSYSKNPSTREIACLSICVSKLTLSIPAENSTRAAELKG